MLSMRPKPRNVEIELRKVAKEAAIIEKKYEHLTHWPYYYQCVYPGHQDSYYPEAARGKFASQDVTIDTWKWMVPGQMHRTNSLPRFRWYYPYDNWLRYY